ncbi:hypothetical protein D9M73_245370 [compost metagenome]
MMQHRIAQHVRGRGVVGGHAAIAVQGSLVLVEVPALLECPEERLFLQRQHGQSGCVQLQLTQVLRVHRWVAPGQEQTVLVLTVFQFVRVFAEVFHQFGTDGLVTDPEGSNRFWNRADASRGDGQFDR